MILMTFSVSKKLNFTKSPKEDHSEKEAMKKEAA